MKNARDPQWTYDMSGRSGFKVLSVGPFACGNSAKIRPEIGHER